MQTYIGSTNIISSLGFTTEENFANLSKYKSGIGKVIGVAGADPLFLAATIDSGRLRVEAMRLGLDSYSKLEQLLILSVKQVIDDSGIDPADESCCFIFSTTKGNIDRLDDSSSPSEEVYLWGMAKRVSAYFGSSVTPLVISNACISGVSAVIVASRLIREGKYKNIVVAGGDLLTRFVVSGFAAFKSLSANPCIPYDEARDGLTLGEGVGSLLLTSCANLSCGVTVEGGAITNDANHISGPSRTGDGLYLAIAQAMNQNMAPAESVSFINAHGTATSFNDEMESKAIGLANMQSVYTNSLKPYFGHTLGAAGVIEIIACAEQLKSGMALGTTGFKTLGVPVPLNVSGEHKTIAMKRCIKTASGFGGCNAAVVLSLDRYAIPVEVRRREEVSIKRTCRIADGIVTIDSEAHDYHEQDFGTFIRSVFKGLNAPNMKFYKMDNLCKLGYIAAELLLKDYSYASDELALVMANSSSSLDTDSAHLKKVIEEGEGNASPSVFVYTLPNVVMGEICIRHGIKGENTFFIDDKYPSAVEDYARSLVGPKGYRAVIVGWCELMGNNYEANFKLIERK